MYRLCVLVLLCSLLCVGDSTLTANVNSDNGTCPGDEIAYSCNLQNPDSFAFRLLNVTSGEVDNFRNFVYPDFPDPPIREITHVHGSTFILTSPKNTTDGWTLTLEVVAALELDGLKLVCGPSNEHIYIKIINNEPPSDIKPSIIDISPRALFIEFDWSPPKNVVVSNYHVRVTWNSRGSRSYHSYNTSAEDNSFKAVFPITSDVTVSIEIQVFTENICRQLSIGSASFTQKFKITKQSFFKETLGLSLIIIISLAVGVLPWIVCLLRRHSARRNRARNNPEREVINEPDLELVSERNTLRPTSTRRVQELKRRNTDPTIAMKRGSVEGVLKARSVPNIPEALQAFQSHTDTVECKDDDVHPSTEEEFAHGVGEPVIYATVEKTRMCDSTKLSPPLPQFSTDAEK